MSMLIKGLELPQKGRNLKAMFAWKDGNPVLLVETALSYDDRTIEVYPLIEVPTPHGDLIDAKAESKRWGLDRATKYGNKTAEQQRFSYSTMMMYEIADILDDAGVVIEAEE